MKMKKVIINENERGLLFKNGRFMGVLDAGKYRTYGGKTIEVVSADKLVSSANCLLNDLLKNRKLAEMVKVVEVPAEHILLYFADGNFAGALGSGKYAFWENGKKHEFLIEDMSKPEVSDKVPEYIFHLGRLSPLWYTKVEVAQYNKARLYFDKKFVRLLEPGTYYFWQSNTNVEAELVDTRATHMTITGQEVLTQDKVSVRLNLVCTYKITDYIKIRTEIDDYTEQIRSAAQLAMREYIGRNKLDDILANKDDLSKYVFGRLKEREKDMYVDIAEAAVRDIILPGEIRDIMNTVLVAEKRAQANVITRREEVASTRSLLNTAKLMEENKTLYKLKELEFIERICENVGNITLNGSGDILTQLVSLTDNRSE